MKRVHSSLQRRLRSVCVPALGATAACLSLGCGGEAEPDGQLSRSHSDLSAQVAGAGVSCDELLARFKSSLLAQVQTRAEQARLNPYLPLPVPEFGAPEAAPPVANPAVADSPVANPPVANPPVANPLLASPRGAPLPAPGAASPRFSTTTPLASGVEPADLIQADGERLYLVHDRSLLVLDAADPSAPRLMATVPLGDGTPSELLVHEGRALVFSNVYEGLEGLSRPLDPYLYPSYFAKLTVVDARGASPTILRESYFEGSYVFAGLAGGIARSFIQQYSGVGLDYPPVSYVDLFGVPRSQEDIDRQIALWVELTTATLEESTLEDYLPEQYERVAGQLVPVPVDCGSLVLASSDGSSVGSSVLVSVDLGAAQPTPASIPLFGYAQSVSFSANTAILFEQDYGSAASPEVRLVLHAFEFDGVAGNYLGSASAPGYLNGNIGVDESRGVISALLQRDVFDSEQGFLGSESRLQTFGLEQDGLSVLGESADLPGEYAQAVRFDGARAYLMSSGIDSAALLVADLSDPGAPAVAGSLALAGSSSLLVPFGAEQLLTVTQGYDPVTFASRNELQVVDVQDPTAPVSTARLSLGADIYSDAFYDPRAITFHPDQSVFSLPLQSYVDGSSSLELFALSGSGLERLGGIVHERGEPTLLECLVLMGYPTDGPFLESLDDQLIELLLQDCRYYRFGAMRRGLFRGQEVFALSTVALTEHSLGALDETLGSVDLPRPEPAPGVPLPPVPNDVVLAPAEGEPAAQD